MLRRSMTQQVQGRNMAAATLLISSKNYSSWSLRGFLLCHLARVPFEEKAVVARRSRQPGGTFAAVVVDPGALSGA